MGFIYNVRHSIGIASHGLKPLRMLAVRQKPTIIVLRVYLKQIESTLVWRNLYRSPVYRKKRKRTGLGAGRVADRHGPGEEVQCVLQVETRPSGRDSALFKNTVKRLEFSLDDQRTLLF